jgi:UDP-glucose 4-epimerase
MTRILITGASGYIGSCLYKFLRKEFNVIGIDKKKSKIKNLKFKRLNILNKKKLYNFFKREKKIDIIIHLAGESTIDNIEKKEKYVSNNTNVTKNILEVAKIFNINKFIFSSTAAVYKSTNKKLTERSLVRPNNIYGKTKLECEKLIKKENLNYSIFRFFNVCSSYYEEKIGEMHSPETHLIPIVVNKMLKSKKLKIYGSNYNTKDGTCIRDYIHIKDLCIAHYLAINKLKKKKFKQIINLGTSKGFSTLEIVKTVNKIENNFKYVFSTKRLGDSPKLVCSNNKAKKILNWSPINSDLKRILHNEMQWQKYLNLKKIKIKMKY